MVLTTLEFNTFYSLQHFSEEPMNKHLFALIGTALICGLLLLILPYANVLGQDEDRSGPTLIYLPSTFQNHNPATPATATPTLISTAPTQTPTQTPTLTSSETVTPTSETPTIEPTLTPTNTPVTGTTTESPTATPSPTPSPSATPTITSTPGPTPTATNTSVPYPSLTFTCDSEPATGDSVLLNITVSSETPVPSTESFRFDPTEKIGPVTFGANQFALAVLFTDDTEGTAPGRLAECESPNLCRVIYTLTDTDVTRDIGKTVACDF